MKYWDWMNSHDRWKTRPPFEPPEIEILITDIRQVPEEMLMIDDQAVIDAWREGQRDFPGLDVCEVF